tara:strand:- start:157 stop:627 length:471 start_codon:yes stop_codon:yes gene_type:complete
MNLIKANDLKFGEVCEGIFLSVFKNYKKKSSNIMDAIDFKHKTKNKLAELKGRKYNFTDCKDWKVSMNKLTYHQKYNKGGDFFVYMLFYDGLYFWKYNAKEVRKKDCGWDERVDRGKTEKNFYFNIKRELFKKSKYDIVAPKDMSDVKNIKECLID